MRAVQAAAPQLTAALNAAVPQLERGGRLVYVGAGTSGRLGVLDATELTPTFSWPPERAVPLIAGASGPSGRRWKEPRTTKRRASATCRR
ncbi:hypothetical protein MSS93_15800 [Deinococcus radiodurans]|nr:hypothetical protein MSS93_15800 [Deinococcus radiodurans]